jgi:hypothetical protein
MSVDCRVGQKDASIHHNSKVSVCALFGNLRLSQWQVVSYTTAHAPLLQHTEDDLAHKTPPAYVASVVHDMDVCI